MITAVVFYIFAALLLLGGLCVISARNPVHSVLWLVFSFFNAAGLFVLLGAEYLAMTLVIVYVGAVAVLFLFVVMMLNVNLSSMREGFLAYLPLGGVLAAVLLAEILLMIFAGGAGEVQAMAGAGIPPLDEVSNTRALGRVLYTDYAYLFQLAGLILLVAMIGAIVLTLRSREGVRKQNITRQVMRDPKKAIEVVKVPTGSGV